MFLALLLKGELLGQARLRGVFKTRLPWRHLLMLLLKARQPIRCTIVIQYFTWWDCDDVVLTSRYGLIATGDGSRALAI